MAALAAIGGIISAVASAAGGIVSAMGAANAANEQAAAKDAEAQEQRRKGIQEDAAKQQEASQREYEMKRVLSDQRAGFAASGGGIDGSAAVVAGETAQKGIFNRDATLWEGAEAKAGREAQARMRELEAQALRKSAKTQMISGVLGGVSNVFGSFKGGGSAGSSGGGNFFYG